MPTGIYPRSKRGPYRIPRHEVTQPLDESIKLIPLTQGQNAIVDAVDFEWLNQFNWCSLWCEDTKSFYAHRKALINEPGRQIRMHRMILGCSAGEDGDHKDGDTLNNRRCNLRKCSRHENSRNHRRHSNATSGFTGVSFRKDRRKWQAYIGVGFKMKHLGFFPTVEEAARARDAAAKIYHKEFARLNFS